MKLPRRSVCEGFRASQACSPVLYTDTALCHLGTRRLYLVNVMVSFVLLNVRYYYDSQTPFLSQIDSLLFVSKKKKLRMLNTKVRLRRLPGWQWTELLLLCLRGQEMCEEKDWWGLVLTVVQRRNKLKEIVLLRFYMTLII